MPRNLLVGQRDGHHCDRDLGRRGRNGCVADVRDTKSVPTVVGMPPIPELRSDEYMKGLPVREIREPF
jgi:hypothetical protein